MEKKRFTPEQIKSKAEDHVAYGWAPSPGTHDMSYDWTKEDHDLYMKFFNEARTYIKPEPI